MAKKVEPELDTYTILNPNFDVEKAEPIVEKAEISLSNKDDKI